MKLDWRKTKDEKPAIEDTVIVMTERGEREAQVEYGNYYGWRLMDCTHPLQNTFLSFDDGRMWRAL